MVVLMQMETPISGSADAVTSSEYGRRLVATVP